MKKQNQFSREVKERAVRLVQEHSADEGERIKAMERELKELRRANEILKSASAFFAQAALDRELKK